MARARSPELLHYRPWTGTFRGPWASVWPIARVALGMLFRRRLFWVLYALSLMIFLLFFFGQYLLAYAETQAPPAKGQFNPRDIVGFTFLQFVVHVPVVLFLLWLFAGTLTYIPPVIPQ